MGVSSPLDVTTLLAPRGFAAIQGVVLALSCPLTRGYWTVGGGDASLSPMTRWRRSTDSGVRQLSSGSAAAQAHGPLVCWGRHFIRVVALLCMSACSISLSPDELSAGKPDGGKCRFTLEARPAPVTGSAYDVATADLDGDDLLDLVFAANDKNALGDRLTGPSVWLGLGDGTFESWYSSWTFQHVSFGIAAATAADGSVVVAKGIASQDSSLTGLDSGHVRTYAATKTGTLDWNANESTPRPRDVVLADLDGDGSLDLAAISSPILSVHDDKVYVFFGEKDGLTSPPVVFDKTSIGNAHFRLATGDFNRDQYADLVVSGPGDVSVILGSPSRKLTAMGPFSADAPVVVGVAVGEFNGDGKQDVVVSKPGDNAFAVLLGVGDGSFLPHKDHAMLKGVSELAVADLDQDGHDDVIGLAKGQVALRRGLGDGTFELAQDYPSNGTHESGIATGDFDRDGRVDVVIAGWSNESPTLLMGACGAD